MVDVADVDYDILVVGGGGAGLAAASAAAEAGARVALLEAGERVGGSTALSQGAFLAAGTEAQKKAGVSDNAEELYKYGLALNQSAVQPSILRRYARESAEVIDWLTGMGVNFSRVSTGDESDVPRSHWAEGLGAEIVYRLEARLQAQGVDVVTRSRVSRLLAEDGRVSGVEVGGEVIRASAVVVASGGMGNNRPLVEKYYPTAALEGDDTYYIGAKTNVGDHVGFARDVGADLFGFDRGLRLSSSNFQPILDPPPAWLLYVNLRGHRFVREGTAYNVMAQIIDRQPERIVYGIFDQAAFLNPPIAPEFAAAIASGHMNSSWMPGLMDEWLAAGRLVKAGSIEDLANKLALPPEALANTIKRYNDQVEAGSDPDFFKEPRFLIPISQAPFYAARIRPGVLVFTSMGLRIDADARVLDSKGSVIGGLYAAGESAGGLMNEIYLGSGYAVGSAITYGRVAGREAAHYAMVQSSMGEFAHDART
jgi:fumarate reductase flavoprotein subunit